MTHLLHVNPDNVEEFMAKLAETSAAPVSKRPSVLRSKHKERNNPKIDKKMAETVRGDASETGKEENNEVQLRVSPKPPARPLSCIAKVSSEPNLQGVDEMKRSLSGISLDQEMPPRPKLRPMSMRIAAGRNNPNERPVSTDDTDNHSSATQGSFTAPKPPPRRPPSISPRAAESIGDHEGTDTGAEGDDLYTSIDETVRIPLKPRGSVKTNDSKVKPPLPPRRLTEGCIDDSSDTVTPDTIPSSNEPPIVSNDVSEYSMREPGDMPLAMAEALITGEFEAADLDSSVVVPDVYSALEMSDVTEVSHLYGVVNKPRSGKKDTEVAETDAKIADISQEALDTPIPGNSAPPLPPRAKESFMKKAPPLPPRPNME